MTSEPLPQIEIINVSKLKEKFTNLDDDRQCAFCEFNTENGCSNGVTECTFLFDENIFDEIIKECTVDEESVFDVS